MRLLQAAFILSAAFLMTGCRQDDDIHQETITYPDRQPIRLRVAILKQGESDWFIRIEGPVALMNEHEKAFDAFVRSSKFKNRKDQPLSWTEPKEWKKDPSDTMSERYATYRIPARPKELEIKVSRMPVKGSSLMKNMHRWQAQVNVPLSERAEDNEKYLKREKLDGKELMWIDMTGLGTHTVSKPPDQADDDRDNPFRAMNLNQGPKSPFKYTVPDDWEKGKVRGKDMIDIYYVSGEGKDSAEVTFTRFRGDGGGVPANIDRWRGQVELPKLSPKEILDAANTKMIPDVASYYYDLNNPTGPPEANRILGVVIPLGDSTYFVKMTGPSEYVGKQKNDFEAFVKSFKK